ncbi:MAG: biotin synthase BioB, partial [Actinomycetota bacterium]|nr:biotin synthase BioB [Actinomycetota bacterium]
MNLSVESLLEAVPDRNRVAMLAGDPEALLADVETNLLDRRTAIGVEEAFALAELGDHHLEALLALAHRVRVSWRGEEVSLESIVSAKTGGCPEDCAFCSQSATFPRSVQPQPPLSSQEVVAAALEARALGATEFCLVYAVRGPDDRLFNHILELVATLRAQAEMDVAVSAGILDRDQARRLAEAGVVKYNHNLEAARSFFPRIVSSHTWEERAETLGLVREHGMQVCTGGLVGVGETRAQRAELALQLAAFQPTETPLNFLNPRPGTPLGQRSPMEPREALHAVALFRLVLPWTLLRYAGGREVALRDLQAAGILGGADGLIIGNYLTTLGRPPSDDLDMLRELGVPLRALP